jgi:hypothetical protein
MEQKNKSRILYVLKLLYEKTDEQNPLSTVEIINYLAGLEISAHRRTIAADMELLEEFGIDVITIKSTQNKYFIGSREFELPEIKLLEMRLNHLSLLLRKKAKIW